MRQSNKPRYLMPSQIEHIFRINLKKEYSSQLNSYFQVTKVLFPVPGSYTAYNYNKNNNCICIGSSLTYDNSKIVEWTQAHEAVFIIKRMPKKPDNLAGLSRAEKFAINRTERLSIIDEWHQPGIVDAELAWDLWKDQDSKFSMADIAHYFSVSPPAIFYHIRKIKEKKVDTIK